VTKNIEKYVNRYDLYQRMKNRTEASAVKLMTNEVPEKSWTYLTVDFTKLPLVVEKNIIFVII